MDFQLYTEVVLQTDVPGDNLQADDVGTVVDRHDVGELEPGYSIEFFDMLGQTVAVATLPGSLLRVPTNSDRPAVRSEVRSA